MQLPVGIQHLTKVAEIVFYSIKLELIKVLINENWELCGVSIEKFTFSFFFWQQKFTFIWATKFSKFCKTKNSKVPVSTSCRVKLNFSVYLNACNWKIATLSTTAVNRMFVKWIIVAMMKKRWVNLLSTRQDGNIL